MKQKHYFIIALNSLVYFLMAFLIVKNLTNLYGLLLANMVGISGELFYYGFTLDWTYEDVNNTNLTFIYLLSYFVTLLTGIVFERIYHTAHKHYFPFKMLFLWIYIIAVSRFFGYMILGSFKYYGMGVFFNMFQWSMPVKIIVASIAALLLLTIGIISSSNVRSVANLYFKEIGEVQMGKFFFYQAFLPIIVAFPFVFLYKYPHHSDYSYYDSFVYFSLFIFMAGQIIGRKYMVPMQFKKRTNRARFYKQAFIALVFVVILFRVGLNWGIKI